MSDIKKYVLVNPSRVFEGTLKNLMPPNTELVPVSSERVLRCLFFSTQEFVTAQSREHTGDTADRGGESLSHTAGKIASILAAEGHGKPAGAGKSTGFGKDVQCPGETINPDCILYQLSQSDETDAKMVRYLRRACAFRDVPIFAVADYKDLIRAKSYLPLGADDIIVFPSQPAVVVKKLTEALEPIGIRIPIITKIINPYIGAVVDLLSTMANLHAEKKEIFLKKSYRLFGDISAIMSLSGKVEGEVVVCFEERLAREVVSRIMATQPEQLTKDELSGGIGEVVNIVAGNAKAVLAASEYAHQIALPTVVMGPNHEIAHPGNAPCIVVIFEVAQQPMAILVSMALRQD